MEYEFIYKKLFLWIGSIISLSIFVGGMISNIYIWRKGKKDKGIDIRLLPGALIQRDILRFSYIRWVNYMLLSMGFLALFMNDILLSMSRFIFGKDNLPKLISCYFDISMDMLGLFILLGVLLSFFRRYVLKSPQLRSSVEDSIAILLIFIMVITGFLIESLRIINSPYSPEHIYSLVGFSLSYIIPPLWGKYYSYIWVFHSLIALIFIAYIPYSNFVHIFTCPIIISKKKGD
jgi:nitrate reductase gamma subunit